VSAKARSQKTEVRSAIASTLAIEWWPISRPKPYPANARKLSARAVETLALSLKQFGWRQPIVVDVKDVIVAGHTRLLAAQAAGMTEVPVHVARELTAAQIRAYRIMDNRSADETEWDMPTLAAELQELHTLEVDLETTGFTQAQIDRALAYEGTNEDFAPPAPEKPASKLGDVWLLGAHRVICGDSTSKEVVAKLLGDRQPHLLVTDPPYGILLDLEWRDRAGFNAGKQGASRDKNGLQAAPAAPSYMKKRSEGHNRTSISGDTRADWSEAFALVPSMSEAFALVPSIEVAYVWHASLYTREVLDGLLRLGFLYPQQIIWNKGQASMTRTHYWYQHEPCWFVLKHEPCWYVRKKNAPWFGQPGKNSTIWESPSPKMIMGGSEEQKYDHPTQKPAILMQRPIQNHLQRGELVYDGFLGSGTTLIAAEMSERVCCGVELAPEYVDVIVLRWQAFTGQAATLDGDGRTFEKIAAARKKK
jgi:DNA modification methylase